MKSIAQYRKELTERFEKALFESSSIECDYIISEVTRIPHIELVLYPERLITEKEMEKMESFAARRLAHEPFQYIFGWTPFREIDLKVAPGVLIPRPETEGMVDLVLKALPAGGRVCELGVGSGAISLSIAFERKDAQISGSEISPAAFRIAEENRKRLALPNVNFFQGDLFAPFSRNSFHVITANLPYIPYEEKDLLPENVRKYEPEEALFAPDEGFAVIERAILSSPDYFISSAPCALIFELGEKQTQRAVKTAEKTHFFTKCMIRQDVFGVPRFLCAYRE